MGRKIYEKVNQVVDHDTGEVTTTTKQFVREVSHEAFIQVYLEDLSSILGIESAIEIKLLVLMFKDSTINSKDESIGNRIVIVKALKEEWARSLNCKVQYISNLIVSLAKKGLICKSKNRAIYYLNPNLFFKGYTKDRPAVIKALIKYTVR